MPPSKIVPTCGPAPHPRGAALCRCRQAVFIDDRRQYQDDLAYGRAPRGRRLLAKALLRHWKTTTFVAALRRAGLDAPMVLDGPMTTQPSWPTSSKRSRRCDPTRSSSWTTCRPTRSPRCVPHRRGSALSTAALFARHEPDRDGFRQTQDTVAPGPERTRGLWRRIGALLDQFTPEECTNYFSELPAIATIVKML